MGGALLSALAVLACAGCGAGSPAPPRPPVVEVASVVQRDVSVYGEWVATLDGYVNAQIQPQVTGYLIRQDYREGSLVRKNDVLFEIDPRPFEAALDAAKAQLAQAQAQLGNATLNVQRDIPEAQASAIPRSQLDNDRQTELAGKAAVAAGKAAVERAALNLGFTKVRSLIGGIAGIAQVQVGNLVTPATVLTAVSDVNPIKAYFPVSSEEYLEIAGKIAPEAADSGPARRAGPADPPPAGSRLPLQLVLSNGSTYDYPGTALFADRQVDPQTGTIRVVGAFPNPRNILRPGQYGKIRAVTHVRKGALLVPQRAVTQLQGSYQVAVVGQNDTVAVRTVETGERIGPMWIITSGLRPGDRVVVEGFEKVHDGSKVTPVPFNPAATGTGAE